MKTSALPKADKHEILDLSKSITIWPFAAAPEQYRKRSPHGGDEDWLALVPPRLAGKHIRWLAAPYFGNEVAKEKLPSGWDLVIGAHAGRNKYGKSSSH